jgi:hypothetical protein
MNLKNQRPIFVPSNLQAEIEALSKAALMDVAWNLAARLSGLCDDPGEIMKTLRGEIDVTLHHRKAEAKKAA